jgi:hypothetical protein
VRLAVNISALGITLLTAAGCGPAAPASDASIIDRFNSHTLGSMLSSVARWVGQFRLFQRDRTHCGLRNIILWWEARRLPFNAIVGLAGVLSGLLILGNAFITERVLGEPIGLPNPPLFALIAVIAYSIMANICFTGGWIAKLISRRVWGDRVDAFGEVALALGTIFSVLLTLLPAALIVSISSFKMLFHS